ncbi:glycosyl hydrolase [Streptomyces adustus]|uniref:glycosyl hydrolase n=1 Tax=Streptomyces adustus TaxID=1609272 RepID=UPI003721B741
MSSTSSDASRRTVLASGVALAAAAGTSLALPGTASALPRESAGQAASGAVTGTFEAKTVHQRPMFRYWWPGGGVTPAEVTKEVEAMAAAGFGGFEIGDVRNSEMNPMPVQQYGWGTPAWQDGVTAALRTAARHGLQADLTIGPYWPAVVPGVLPDDDEAMKELTYGRTVVDGGATYNADLPAPHQRPSGVADGLPEVTVTNVVQGVHAAKISGSSTASPLVLEESTVVDLTSEVSNGKLKWTAPSGGQWVVIASYSRGTAMIERQVYYQGYYYSFTDPQAYVVDHFGAKGGRAITNWWDKKLITSEMRKLLGQVGGNFFEDSLEFLVEVHWTPNMLKEFSKRRGYSLKPYLFLAHGKSKPVYTFAGGTTADRVRWDYQQTLSDLFVENHVTLIDDWAGTLDMSFRNQAYGGPVDTAYASAGTGVPEGESLAFGSTPDSFRLVAAGRDIGRSSKVLSSEMGANVNGAFRLTLADLVSTANPGYALGVNQVRIHGFPYASSPGGQWPGFYPWAPMGVPINFAEAWGPRQPQWQVIDGTSGYFARVQAILQSGTSKVDLAVYREGFDSADGTFDDGSISDAGYSYQLLSWGLLGLSAAGKVKQGRLAADGPAYKALIVPALSTILLESAKRILALAKAGLPVVLVGDLPTTSTGNLSDAAVDDKALASVLKELKACSHVVTAAAVANVPAALAKAGVKASGAPTGISGLLHSRREDGNTTYYFLLNNSSAAVSGSVTLEGEGTPYRIDPWTGDVTPLGVYDDRTSGRVTVAVSAKAKEAVVIALSGSHKFGCHHKDLHAVSATTEVRHTESGLVARASAAGTYTATLSNGRKAGAQIGSLPPALSLSGWELDVEDWTATHPGATGTDAVATTRTHYRFSLDKLVSWQGLDGLGDSSGIGTYTATFTVPASWKSVGGAVLDLGSVGAGSVKVTLDGKKLAAVNQLDPVIDLGSLKQGSHTIVVTVATTLMNRVKQLRPNVFTAAKQDYGLLGTVTVTPYAEAALR